MGEPKYASSLLQNLFGNGDENIRRLEEITGVHVALRDGEIILDGASPEAVAGAEDTIRGLVHLCDTGWTIDPAMVQYVAGLSKDGTLDRLTELDHAVVATSFRGRQVRCRTLGQHAYVTDMKNHTLTFAIGPAGTGKTYLAMAMAVSALKNRQVERIVLTRPAVEAGEKLGFLPGDLNQKVDPYLRPLFDAMFELLGTETSLRYQEKGIIEVAPLAYMRGRTLSDAFIILDEAQNTTREQMKMFLTRMGFRSKIVVTGDPSPVDLPRDKRSGLDDAVAVLEGVKDIAISRLTASDVVRHELVQAIVRAYEAHETGGRGA